MSSLSRLAGVAAACVFLGLSALQAGPPADAAGPTLAELIDKLADVKDADVGYSESASGSVFLPLDRDSELDVLNFSPKPLVSSPAMREIVKRGAAAVPDLLNHLDDRRPTKLEAVRGQSGLEFSNRCDTNPRVTVPALPDAADDEAVDADMPLTPSGKDETYTLTVGDLCFVALGQIVNRNFDAVRYVPPGVALVTSPTRSPALRAEVRRQWGGLTPASHRAALAADCQTPDAEDRLIGACKRLAYYHPDALEPLALQLLKQPEYDEGEVRRFIQKLYQSTDRKEWRHKLASYRSLGGPGPDVNDLAPLLDAKGRRGLLDAFVARHGPAVREGIHLELFEDLAKRESEDGPGVSPEKSLAARPRRVLADLYGWPDDVTSRDRPQIAFRRTSEKARYVSRGLVFDDSPRVDRAFAAYLAGKPNADMAIACIERLVGRGYDADIERSCRLLIKDADDRRLADCRRILDRLGWTPLHVAVDRRDPDLLRAHLARGVEPDDADRLGQTPLHLAAAAGDAGLVRILLEAKAAVDPKDSDGHTPAQLASDEDHADVVRLLGSRGCAATDIFLAASLGNTERLAALLRADGRAWTLRNSRGATPLFLAAREGSAKAVELLLAAGADPNAEDETRWTPLHAATAFGREEAVAVLLRGKANVRQRIGDRGPEPLHLAAEGGRAKIAELLLAHKADPEAATATKQLPLHLAVAAGSVATARVLLEHGAPVDATDKEGETPLHYACKQGNAELARLLLDHGAGVSVAAGEVQRPAIHFAAESGSREVIELLLARKAELNATTVLGETALHVAAAAGRVDAARLLLDRGAPVDAVTKVRKTPLHHAVMFAPSAMAELLLDHKADPNARDPRGETPLHDAVESTNLKVVRLLLERGADRGAKNNEGKTPLDLAADPKKERLGQKELIAILNAPAERERKPR